ncbi:SpoIIE family protein phosphatase [Angustibacter aerolatus]
MSTQEHAAVTASGSLVEDAQRLYDAAPCGYLSTAPDGTVVQVNATFLALTGYSADELVGRRRFIDLLSGGGRIYYETHYAPMLSMQGSAQGIALDLVRADGRRLPTLVNAVLDRDEAGAPRVVRVAVFDATDRRAYERELLRAKERAEASEDHARALARTLQQTLIPPLPPDVPGLEVAAVYRPAGAGAEVGGDFYDVFQLAEDDWFVVLGDVCGKGPGAAVVTSLLRHAVRAAAVASPDVETALRLTNDVLLRDDSDRFCTALLARLRRRAGRWHVTLCAAGHPLPVLVPATGTTRLVGAPGSLLGVLAELELHATELELAPGDRLLLYTDGVTEARRDRVEYGDDRLLAQAAGAATGAHALVTAVLDDALAFQGGVARDDIALLALTPSSDP